MAKIPLPVTEGMSKNDQDLVKAVNRIDDWKGLELSYEPVIGGITNPNYKITVDGQTFFLKIPGAGTEAFIDRKNCHVANGPRVAYFFEDTGVEVFDWIHGYRTMTWGDAYNKRIFLKTADLIRCFNEYKGMTLPLTQTAFDQTFLMMRLARENNAYLPPEIDKFEWLTHRIEDAILAGGIDYKPCHNDYWCNNIVINDETGDVKLLDYEYASMNDEGYDMGIYSGMNYFTEEMDVAFIKRYYGFFNEEKFARLKLYKILADIKWSMWAVVQDKIASVKFDYMNWYGMKIARLRPAVLDPRLDYWLNLVGKKSFFTEEEIRTIN
jgi:thiamine kinase-like enzyme